MKTLNNVEEYSHKYDEIMNAELELVHNAYDGRYGEYSIKIPNSMTKMELIEFYDGDQPSYNSLNLPKYLEEDNSLADYPRHDSTLRIFYKSLEKTTAALFYIKEFGEINEWWIRIYTYSGYINSHLFTIYRSVIWEKDK